MCNDHQKRNTASGVYIIKNKVNGKFYIGSSKDLRHRFNEHKFYLNKGIHRSALQFAWNKYGEVSFEFGVLELCEEEVLLQREQHYLDLYKPFVDCGRGYNILKEAKGGWRGCI